MAQILILPLFRDQIKKLSKRLRTKQMKYDINDALQTFIHMTDKQRENYSIGRHEYKIRIGSSDMQKGKRGAFRSIIVLADVSEKIFIPYALYYKGDFDDLPMQLRNSLLQKALVQLEEWNENISR